MPIYEYSCKKCGKSVELLQKSGADNAGIPCPACSEDTLTKVLSVTAPSQMAKRSTTGCDMAKHSGGCGGCCSGCH
ncbi:FmdB family zinc ribbon protein [Sporomusa termitida]|uniref:FmdB family zinc ribbon protein n=1 Tax=Sporomusa termitida TaxID=2377 RepID=UPI001185E831